MTQIPANPETSRVSFDQLTVELDSLQKAAYALADLMTVDISVVGDRYVCELFPRYADADFDVLAHRMRSEVIDQTLRFRIARETEPLRNLIFALAFSRTGLSDAEPQ
jgi:His-Xaa-Ser system protein HxsD